MTATERRADQLRAGDRLEIGGTVWTVTRAKVKGKQVRLAVEGRKGAFERLVKAKARYTLAGEQGRTGADPHRPTAAVGGSLPAQQRADPRPLLSLEGAQTRWATPDDLEDPVVRESDPWQQVTAEDRVLIEGLGARLVGVEVEGGKLVVPPVSDATILGHLLTMHEVRFDGASVADAKAWAREHSPAGPESAQEVIDALTFEKAYRLHDDLHKDLLAMPRPHWHREEAPR